MPMQLRIADQDVHRTLGIGRGWARDSDGSDHQWVDEDRWTGPFLLHVHLRNVQRDRYFVI